MSNNKQRRQRRKTDYQNKDVAKVNPRLKESGRSGFTHNDPQWYIYDPEMFKGVIQMPTLEFKGADIEWLNHGNTEGDAMARSPQGKIQAPSVAVYHMNPAIQWNAVNLNPTDPALPYVDAVNLAARKMYAELSASNAKTSGYAPQDIATLILGLGQIISIISHLKRMYGIAMYFNFYNRSISETIFRAVGLDQGTRSNLSNVRARINALISKVDTILFPSGMNYFKKCEYIYSNLFVDRDEKMLSYHLMVPNSTWKIDEDDYEQGTILKTTMIHNYDAGYTTSIGTIIDTVEAMVESILTSSTFNFIFADIINLANRNVLNAEPLHIEFLPIDYIVEPLYSEQFNWQIMNMTIVPHPTQPRLINEYGVIFTGNNDVLPAVDHNLLIYNPAIRNASNTLGPKISKMTPVRIPDTNVDQDTFVELLAYYSDYGVTYTSSGTSVNYFNLTDFYCVGVRYLSNFNGTIHKTNTNGLEIGDINVLNAMNQFVHAPYVYLITGSGIDDLHVQGVSRISSFTQVSPHMLRNLRYETFLGLLSFRK